MTNINLIKNLISQGESEQLEFLTTIRKDNIAKIICSFLNSSGGSIVIGVDEEGKIIGVKTPVNSRDELNNFLITGIVPEAPITVTIEEYQNKSLIVIKVQSGSKQPYIFNGGIYYRKDNKTTKASSNEISDLIHNRQNIEKRWERRICPNVDVSDINRTKVLMAMIGAKSGNRTNHKGEHYLEFLSYYGLYVDGYFTNAAVLLFGNSPSMHIPQMRVRLTEFSESKTDDNLLKDELFESNLFDIRDKLEKYTNSLGTRSSFDKNQWKRKDFQFPTKALQEGIINALIHRDYSSVSSGLSISVYPDRVKIRNSGQLPLEITISDLKKDHQAHPVNPDIAQFFFLVGYIDKLGRGTNRILEQCKEAGLRTPVWRETNSEVILTFYGPKTLPEMKPHGIPIIKYSTRNINHLNSNNNFVNDTVNDIVNDTVNDTVSKIVKNRLIKELNEIIINEGINTSELISNFDISMPTLKRDIAILKENELITFEGASKTGLYKPTKYLLNKLSNDKIK
ncbi:MAG: putative DNA binding domain-containing protein [Candidatus Marinimicrobia bacterium]|nr:putative DNA binding domain-containing protein [Candidatus Neomarinimicrobiota bacterium]